MSPHWGKTWVSALSTVVFSERCLWVLFICLQWLTGCPRPYPQPYKFHDVESGTPEPTSFPKLYSDIIPLLSHGNKEECRQLSDR